MTAQPAQWLALSSLVIISYMCVHGSAVTGPVASGEYVEYLEGQVNIILTAPHGGYLTPASIPDRGAGCLQAGQCNYVHNCGTPNQQKCKVVTSQDAYTREMTLLIRDELAVLLAQKPHVVINNLHRRKLDANRDVMQAAFGVPEAVSAYEQYTEYINQAKASFNGQPGILFDIHGVASHPEQWVEVGYRITTSQLNSGLYTPEDSSIRALLIRKCGNYDVMCHEKLISGYISVGGMIQMQGYSSVPSPVYPSPGQGKYYRGGYTTEQHGSRTSGNVDAIQIESPSPVRNQENAPEYARAVAFAIASFYLENY